MSLVAMLFAIAGAVDTSGRIRLSAGTPPESITLTLRNSSAKAEEIAVTCPVSPNGVFHCTTPAGRFDIRIAIPGFAPIYQWDLALDPPKRNLGQIAARRTSSVAGWVVHSENRNPVPDATVELLDSEDQPARATSKTNGRGFFQIVGLEPGKYGIRTKAKGTSTVYIANVVVRESAETLLDKPITLAPPATLPISITPHMKAPRMPWQIDLLRRIPLSTYTRMAGQTTVDTAGNAVFSDLQSGSYVVAVHDARGTVFARETIEIDGTPPPLFIQIAAVPIRGRLHAGVTGIKASLDFSSDHGEFLAVRSDEEGTFQSLLPAAGKWRVQVTLPSRQEVYLPSVEIRRRDTEEFARVDLELPPGQIKGRVVDEKGDGVKTGIRLTRQRVSETGTLSDEDGSFSLVGLATGEVVLNAGSQELDSGAVPVTVSEDTAPITITLHKTRKLKGWITTPSGYPIAGATIWYWWEGALHGQTMSGLSGLFEFSFAPTASSIDLLVVAPDVPVKMIRLAAPTTDERIHLTTSATPGRLVIRLPPISPPLPTVSSGGVTASLMLIIRPGTIGGARPPGLTREGMMVDVEPGQYTVCLNDHCSTVDVAPGAQVRVDTVK